MISPSLQMTLVARGRAFALYGCSYGYKSSQTETETHFSPLLTSSSKAPHAHHTCRLIPAHFPTVCVTAHYLRWTPYPTTLQPIFTLTLNPNNPANTTLLDESGNTIYTIRTLFDGKGIPTTSVHGENGKRVADWRWRDTRLGAQMLRFEGAGVGVGAQTVDANGKVVGGGGRGRVAASRWLKKSPVPFKSTVVFQDVQGSEHKWKNNDPGLYLQLVSTLDSSTPIARFVPPTIDHKLLKPTPVAPAKLLLSDDAEEIMDEVVVSWALLEIAKREKEVADENRISVGPLVSV